MPTLNSDELRGLCERVEGLQRNSALPQSAALLHLASPGSSSLRLLGSGRVLLCGDGEVRRGFASLRFGSGLGVLPACGCGPERSQGRTAWPVSLAAEGSPPPPPRSMARTAGGGGAERDPFCSTWRRERLIRTCNFSSAGAGKKRGGGCSPDGVGSAAPRRQGKPSLGIYQTKPGCV